jgi:hypothetical protein
MKQYETVVDRHIIVYDPIFRREVHVFLNCSDDFVGRWKKKLGKCEGDLDMNPNLYAFSTFISSETEPTIFFVRLRYFNWTIDDQGTLIHELTHVVFRIWEHNNIPFSSDTQEFLAHSVGRLYEDVAGAIFKLRKKRKNT